MSQNDDHIVEPSVDQSISFKIGDREYDAESAKTKIAAQDEHISTIQSENAQLKEQLQQAMTLSEALDKLNNTNVQPSQESQVQEPTSPVSEDQLGEIVESRLQELLSRRDSEAAEVQRAATAKETQDNSLKTLNEWYGDDVDDVVKSYAQDSGLGLQDILNMTKDPVQAKVLLSALQVKNPVSEATPSGSLNTASLAHRAPEGDPNWHKGSSNDIFAELQRLRKLS